MVVEIRQKILQVHRVRFAYGLHRISGIRRMQGSAHLIFVVLTVIMALAGFGSWGVFRHWRFLVEHQLRLNRCVGQVAHQLRDVLNEIESLNRRIENLRLAISAAKLYPPTVPPLQATLTIVVAYQESIRFRWALNQAQWLVQRGCGNRGDSARPLPSLEYQREPPDDLGPQTLSWVGKKPDQFFIQADHKNRHSAATVDSGETGNDFLSFKNFPIGQNQWKTSWAKPRRTNFY